MVVHQQLDQLNHLIADRIGMIGHGNNGSEALSRSTNGSSWNAAAGVLQGMSGGPLGTNLPFGNALLPWNQFPLGSLTNSQPNLQLLALHRINELSRYQANNTSNGLLMGLGLPGQNQPPTLLDYQHGQGPRSGTSMPNAPKNNVSPVPSVDSEDFIDDIFLKARVHKSQVYKPWLEKFRLLLRFRAKYGHCDVPLRTEFEGKKLGIWVNEQRRYKIGKKNRNTLAPERERLLNEIGFAWVGTQERSKKWLKNYEALRNFKQLYGHCLIPQKCIFDGCNLGEWVNNQRKCKNGIGGRVMPPERERMLNEIGFVWRVQEKRKRNTESDINDEQTQKKVKLMNASSEHSIVSDEA